MFQRRYGVSHVAENDQKHAQSTYLHEYLWFKKNLTEKFLLENVLEYFVRSRPKMPGFFEIFDIHKIKVSPNSISHSPTEHLVNLFRGTS